MIDLDRLLSGKLLIIISIILFLGGFGMTSKIISGLIKEELRKTFNLVESIFNFCEIILQLSKEHVAVRSIIGESTKSSFNFPNFPHASLF